MTERASKKKAKTSAVKTAKAPVKKTLSVAKTKTKIVEKPAVVHGSTSSLRASGPTGPEAPRTVTTSVRPERVVGRAAVPVKPPPVVVKPVVPPAQLVPKQVAPTQPVVAAPVPKPPPPIVPKRTEVPPVPPPVTVEKPPAAVPVAVVLKPLSVPVPLTVKELADKLSVSPGELIKHLMGMMMMMTINQLLTEEPVEKLLKIYGCQYQRIPTLEDQLEAGVETEDPAKQVSRPPVVTFMGHVDHGKTSLLDAIRHTRVVEGEAGGITQHIGAYRVMLPKGTITFLDTPGHEAFTAMRARGANVTDIVVLVVAADDGVMPQTVEAIDHARAAEATLVVALNKIDKASANPDKVKKQLMEYQLMSEDWGGKTIIVPVSAKTGDGIDQLLDYLLLEAELMELKADPLRPARGAVLEGKLTQGGGPVGHVMVQSGTLRVGDVLLTGTAWGRVRAMLDARGHRLEEAGPSTPVEILGLNGVPKAGDTFVTVGDERDARNIALRREEELRQTKMTTARRFVTLEEFHQQLQAGRVKSLNLILKADVQGSLEALHETLAKISTEKASLKFLHLGVGAISGPDILLAEASNAVVIGFHVDTTPEAEALAKEGQVDVRRYEIIYQAVNDIRAALEGLLEPKLVEQVIGRAKVLQSFKITKVGTIAGCQVLKGKIARGSVGRIFRGQEKLFQAKINSLKRFKDDVREVTEGMQCGVGLAGFSDFQPDDVIESIEIQQVAAKL